MALASEGGHADFAPRTPIEAALHRWLAAEFGHVSYERILSGAGLVNVYRFLGGDFGRDAAAITAEAAFDERSLAGHALELFASVYGAHAGNVALAYTATGGVYLGGGIAPRIARTLAGGAFMRAFADKGRMSGLVERMPVHVILDDRTALNGAARIASDTAPTSALRRAA
jgi:glucokinase